MAGDAGEAWPPERITPPGRRDGQRPERVQVRHHAAEVIKQKAAGLFAVRRGMCCPPWRQVLNLSVSPVRIPQVKNSWPRVELLRSRPSCRDSLNFSLHGGTFLTGRMRPRAQQDAILSPRLKVQHASCRTGLGSGPFREERSRRFRYVPPPPTAACSCEADTVIARAKPAMNRAEPDGANATMEKSPSWNQSAAKGNFSRYARASEE